MIKYNDDDIFQKYVEGYREKFLHKINAGGIMQNSYRYFENKDCKYFPCHKGLKDFNCLFCYCPMYTKEHCPGNPKYIEANGRKIKNCSDCTFPHQPENYDKIMQILRE